MTWKNARVGFVGWLVILGFVAFAKCQTDGIAPPSAASDAGPTTRQMLDSLNRAIGSRPLEYSTEPTSRSNQFHFTVTVEFPAADAEHSSFQLFLARDKDRIIMLSRSVEGHVYGFWSNDMALAVDPAHIGEFIRYSGGFPSFTLADDGHHLTMEGGQDSHRESPHVSVNLSDLIHTFENVATSVAFDETLNLYTIETDGNQQAMIKIKPAISVSNGMPIDSLAIQTPNFTATVEFDDVKGLPLDRARLMDAISKKIEAIKNLGMTTHDFAGDGNLSVIPPKAFDSDPRVPLAAEKLELMAMGTHYDPPVDSSSAAAAGQRTAELRFLLDRFGSFGPLLLSTNPGSSPTSFYASLDMLRFSAASGQATSVRTTFFRNRNRAAIARYNRDNELYCYFTDKLLVAPDPHLPGGLVVVQGSSPRNSEWDKGTLNIDTGSPHATISLNLGPVIRSDLLNVAWFSRDAQSGSYTIFNTQGMMCQLIAPRATSDELPIPVSFYRRYWHEGDDLRMLQIKIAAAPPGDVDALGITYDRVIALGVPVRELNEWDADIPLTPPASFDEDASCISTARKLAKLLEATGDLQR